MLDYVSHYQVNQKVALFQHQETHFRCEKFFGVWQFGVHLTVSAPDGHHHQIAITQSRDVDPQVSMIWG